MNRLIKSLRLMKHSNAVSCTWKLSKGFSTATALLLSLLANTALADEALPAKDEALAQCNLEDFQTVLQPASSRYQSRAYWLNRQVAKWPGVKGPGKFSLYYSGTGQIVAVAGKKVTGAEGALTLEVAATNAAAGLSSEIAARFKYVPAGTLLKLKNADLSRLNDLHKRQLILVQENTKGEVINATGLQAAGALDDLYAGAKAVADLGVSVNAPNTGFKLWAPTALQVSVCIYDRGTGVAKSADAMQWDSATGIWSLTKPADLSGNYYRYMVDVLVNGVGVVRNRVTDPYSISLTTDSKRSYITRLDAAKLLPVGWDSTPIPNTVHAATDMSVYELHVRDFSINDNTVSAFYRGKYLAFTESNSNAMKHLKALAKAGMTDIHLLPIFDIATVPETGCVTPEIKNPTPDGEEVQAAVSAVADKDCFNWGYDPYHFNAPEGSYSTNPADGAKRILELRQMVTALHKIGLRVGMDVVYNHTFIAGQNEKSVLDRVVPGYYHRLNSVGEIERSTCCDNTATENLMMGKLMVDSVVLWSTAYKIDSFRFDLMAHQPRALMEELQTKLKAAIPGREIQLLGEGWNFGEVADNARFVQASQLDLNGTGIGTFTDRARDAIRGGSSMDSGESLLSRKGYINGLAEAGQSPVELLKAADMVRVGLAGSLRDYPITRYDDTSKKLKDIDYGGKPAGYTSQPSEAVNYVENHDNQTLFDINVYRLPADTSREDRVYVQMLAVATTAFSQGIAYYHAGLDVLRSKSLDRNSFNSGDWFNRMDWTYRDNYFAIGLPPQSGNGDNYKLMQPLLANPAIKPEAQNIVMARDMFRDLLKIRASSALFRLQSAADIQQRLHFYNTGAKQNAAVIAARLDGKDYPGAGFKSVIYFINVATTPQALSIAAEQGRQYVLHPVHTDVGAADKRIAASAKYDSVSGEFSLPQRSAVVFVEL
ncbi:MAG TPA: alpha-1,6-glucosidase domain-containing protein [Cellvibrio sp.]|nr:alpha-1,6-glucosidase domain-containing protein [Cellvibrio sp.]